jgi:hypothetical protein
VYVSKDTKKGLVASIHELPRETVRKGSRVVVEASLFLASSSENRASSIRFVGF